MTLAMITRNGIETLENIVTEVESVLTDDQAHEITLWSDGSLSIDSLLIEGIDSEHISLDLAGLHTLRNFLISTRITEMLAAS